MPDETPLQTAKRQVREAEARVPHQEQFLASLDRDLAPQTAALGDEFLAHLRKRLEQSRNHLNRLRGGAGS